jgi:hypothetical protein
MVSIRSPRQVPRHHEADVAAAEQVRHGVAQVEAWFVEFDVELRMSNVGGGPIELFGVEDAATQVRAVAARKSYIDNPSIVSIKVLEAAHQLRPPE